MTPRGGIESEATPGTWLEIHRGRTPLLVSFPHTGTDIPADIESRLASHWIARKDTDWWVHRLYGMARDFDATTVRTTISRTVIDVNRDPSGASLYPGRVTTELCPLATFDGEPLYVPGGEPDGEEISARRAFYFKPYHAALAGEIERLREEHGLVVLYDAHSIRSRIPRLFGGTLHHFNLGTHDGRSCDPALTRAVEHACEHPFFTRVTDGRFKGGWTIRHHGRPGEGVHAVQMELACRAYLEEPTETVSEESWPGEFDSARAAPVREVLARVLEACLRFAHTQRGGPT